RRKPGAEPSWTRRTSTWSASARSTAPSTSGSRPTTPNSPSKEQHEMAETFWRVRVCLPGSILHLASSTEPVIRYGEHGRVERVLSKPLPDLGDTAGFIDWPAVLAVTWRRTDEETEKTRQPK